MRTSCHHVLFVYILTLVCSARLCAGVMQFEAVLNGSNAVPPNESSGLGYASITFNDFGSTLLIQPAGSYQNLSSPLTSADIHIGAPGQTGPLLLHLTATGGTDGLFIGGIVLSPEEVRLLMDGMLYINIATEFYPEGEIRGQIMLVPAPAAGLAMLIGLGVCRGSRRRHSRHT